MIKNSNIQLNKTKVKDNFMTQMKQMKSLFKYKYMVN